MWAHQVDLPYSLMLGDGQGAQRPVKRPACPCHQALLHHELLHQILCSVHCIAVPNSDMLRATACCVTASVCSQVGTFTRYSSQMRGILCIDTRALSYVLFRAETTGSFTESPLTAFWRSRRYACHSCRQHHTSSATDNRSVAAHKRCSFGTLDTDYLCTDITAGQLRPLSPCEGSLHDALMFEHLKQDTL